MFNKIDIDKWDRKENYNWFTTKNRCKINMTMNVDVTKLVKVIKERKIRCYPTFTYITSKIINRNNEFKMSYNKEGDLGYYDLVHPRYPIFHEVDKKISILWTEYADDFQTFYSRFIEDIEKYGEKRSMSAKGMFPENCFDMSSLPWSSFTSFDCYPTKDVVWLPPFVMVGKFFKHGENTLLPVSLSVHHAVCDGYHASNFFNEFEKISFDCERWINIIC